MRWDVATAELRIASAGIEIFQVYSVRKIGWFVVWGEKGRVRKRVSGAIRYFCGCRSWNDDERVVQGCFFGDMGIRSRKVEGWVE